MRLFRFSKTDDRHLREFLNTIDIVTDWRGIGRIIIGRDGCLHVDTPYEAKMKVVSYCPRDMDEFVENLRRALEESGYSTKLHEAIPRELIVIPREKKRELYVLLLSIRDDAPEEIKREFEKYKGRLIRTIELPEGFELRKSWAGDIMLYFRGYPCSRVFFSHSKSGWYNITHEKPESPEQFVRKANKFRREHGLEPIVLRAGE
jgi:hypothetical protein